LLDESVKYFNYGPNLLYSRLGDEQIGIYSQQRSNFNYCNGDNFFLTTFIKLFLTYLLGPLFLPAFKDGGSLS